MMLKIQVFFQRIFILVMLIFSLIVLMFIVVLTLNEFEVTV